MNDATSVTQFAHKCILEHSLDLLERWLGQTPGRTHRSMIASGGNNLLQKGINYPRGQPTSGTRLLHDTPHYNQQVS